MDLSTLNTAPLANAGVPIEIRHPVTRVPLGITITLAGADSDAYRTFERKAADRRAKDLQATGQIRISPEEVERERIELLVACTLGWEGVEENGAPVAFAPDAARRIYTEFRWLREHVGAAIEDRSNFLPA